MQLVCFLPARVELEPHGVKLIAMNLALSEIELPVRLRFERSLTARKSVG
jgi:hypothetical protein